MSFLISLSKQMVWCLTPSLWSNADDFTAWFLWHLHQAPCFTVENALTGHLLTPAGRVAHKGRHLPELPWTLELLCDGTLGYSLLEQVASLELDDIGCAQSWQRQSLPLNVTRSPGGNGRLGKERHGPLGYSHGSIPSACCPLWQIYFLEEQQSKCPKSWHN